MAAKRLELPESTRRRMAEFRQRVRLVKVTEGLLAAVFGLMISWLLVFVLDRFFDTPSIARIGLLIAGCIGGVVFFPIKYHRWVWKTRRPEHVAVLLKHRFPALGDQLLGVVELVHDGAETGRSESLAAAAVEQVDRQVRDRDLRDAVPNPCHRTWGATTAVSAVVMLLIFVFVPLAGGNAFARWLMPWRNIQRYTFTQFDALPDTIIVPHGESFTVPIPLAKSTAWSPATATAQFANQLPVQSQREDDQYAFEFPPQTQSSEMTVRAGDLAASVQVRVEPRPELSELNATVVLPEYLQQPAPVTQDVRGGVISVVKGASTSFEIVVNRALANAVVDGVASDVRDNRIATDALLVTDSSRIQIEWQDQLGLSSRSPFELQINAVDDTDPAIMLRQDDPDPVILSTEVVTFQIQSRDDFGVKAVGLEWHGQVDSETDLSIESQSKLARQGDAQSTVLEATATFCAESDGVRPQTLELRAWAEDFLPDRGRVYSPSIVLHVLTPDEHAAWMTNQLRRWASLSEDVYEEELRLHDANRQLRQLSANELDSPDRRQQLEQQAASERANGHRLNSVTDQGDRLIRRAMRNPEMLVAHLDVWANALQQLKQIAANRMPSVADLLAEGARAPLPKQGDPAASDPSKTAPSVGNDLGDVIAQAGKQKLPSDKPQVPSITDVESGFNPPGEKTESDDQPPKKDSGGRLSLPTTKLQGGPQPPKTEAPPADDAQQKTDEAVQLQTELLAEFQKVRDDLQNILDDLENSTFVKRLKAASRHQMEVASDLNRTLFTGFGVESALLPKTEAAQNTNIASRETVLSSRVGDIQSDLKAYFERSQEERFGQILAEMSETQITDQLLDVGERASRNKNGEAIARAEYWCDTLDRWAEELVVASQCKSSKGGSKASLPPSIVLEVMRILKAEIDLREETRSTQQAREGLAFADWRQKAVALSETQETVQQRVNDVMSDILALPEGMENFGDEVDLLALASQAMFDAAQILIQPETGAAAIAAETEAIEILLRSKRCNPKGGGGGGTSPGGGGDGTTEIAALALFGPASDRRAVIEHRGVSHASGTQSDGLPEEYREGLDTFFNAIEQ
jgi:hypothetical protein